MPNSQRLLELALKGLEVERANIDDEITQVKGHLNPRPAGAGRAGTATFTTPPKKKMSAAARKKISEAMKRRYAEVKKAGEHSPAASQVRTLSSVGPKRSTVKKQNGGDRLTAAGRKKLSDLMKKRWADKRKDQKVKQKK